MLDQFEAEIETLTMIPSDGGKFEISVNDHLLYSKLQTRRHTEPGEVSGLIRTYLRDGG